MHPSFGKNDRLVFAGLCVLVYLFLAVDRAILSGTAPSPPTGPILLDHSGLDMLFDVGNLEPIECA